MDKNDTARNSAALRVKGHSAESLVEGTLLDGGQQGTLAPLQPPFAPLQPPFAPLQPPFVVDDWVWGRERVLWGFKPDHQYTLKVLEPKVGRAGCLSLQYHHEKSESWFILRGELWALVIVDGKVCTRVMRPGDVQHLPTGVVHRICAISADAQVLESSTPDRHAADKSVPKDVVRLHCVHGRPCSEARNADEAQLVKEAVRVTDEAIGAIERSQSPIEYHRDVLARYGAFSLS